MSRKSTCLSPKSFAGPPVTRGPDEAPAPGEGETLDAVGDGELLLVQRRDGYRFNLDAVLLATFVLAGHGGPRPLRALDLGTGCGVVALLLKRRRPAWEVTGLELSVSLSALAGRNAALNRLDVRVLSGDLRAPAAALGSGYDLVVSNPPYFEAQAGRLNPDPEKAGARHDGTATAADVARAARRLVRPDGAVCLVYGAGRLAVLWEALLSERLVPTRLRCVHPRAGAPAGQVLLEARPQARRTLVVEAPLVVHGAEGQFTPEAQALLSRGGGA